MSQISPPIRILLIGSVVFMAAWFAFLRPGGGEEAIPADTAAPPAANSSAPTTPGQAVSAPGKAVEQARSTAETAANASVQRAGEAGAAPATAPSTGSASTSAAAPSAQAPATAGAPKADLAGSELPKELTDAIDKKVVVLMFGNTKAADDLRVRHSMRKVYKHQGKVVTHLASIDDVSKYAAITRGANVQQSPTVLVIGYDRTVDPLVGYVDSVTINQAVVDALLQKGSLVDKDRYLQKLEGICGDYNDQVSNLKDPRNLKQAREYLRRVEAAGKRFMVRVDNAKVPSKWRGLRGQIDALVRQVDVFAKILQADLKAGKPSKALQRQARKIVLSVDRLDLRLAGYGMEDCR